MTDPVQNAIDLLNRAAERIARQDISEANRLLNEAVHASGSVSNHPAYLFLNGVINAMAGRLGAAEAFYQAAIRLDPKGTRAAEELGKLHLQTGRLKEAGELLMLSRNLNASKGKEDVFVFGDSHANAGFNAVARCKTTWLGSITMHRIGRDGPAGLDFRTYGVPDGAVVVLAVGEIDVRAHILRQRDEKGRALEEIVETLAQRFIACVQANLANYRSLRAAFCSILPPTNTIDPAYHALYGPLQDRRAATEMLNERVRRLGEAAGVAYIDLHGRLRDWNGYLNRAYADTNVHIAPELSRLVEYELTTTLDLPVFAP